MYCYRGVNIRYIATAMMILSESEGWQMKTGSLTTYHQSESKKTHCISWRWQKKLSINCEILELQKSLTLSDWLCLNQTITQDFYNAMTRCRPRQLPENQGHIVTSHHAVCTAPAQWSWVNQVHILIILVLLVEVFYVTFITVILLIYRYFFIYYP